ncbi:hypothetical protein COLINT_02514 [Collinsella intestinalis DSM 13280]|uniref:Uncharacterized protein n=1 Tax=Collinsella intestinalis DSM 13280 TaxID=521003 RepID=C4F8Y8_9ACTN|nr:hypothetical protein COLINT_02514 [Collinsella intestinalis DSM 13280]
MLPRQHCIRIELIDLPNRPLCRVLMFAKKWFEWSPLLEHRGH